MTGVAAVRQENGQTGACRSALRFLSRLVCSGLLTAATAGTASASGPDTVTGRIIDALTGRPVRGARILITPRTVTPREIAVDFGDEPGTGLGNISVPVLGGMRTEADPIAEAISDTGGEFTVALPIDAGASFVRIEVRADGYKPAGNTLVRLQPGVTTSIDFELIAFDLDPLSVRQLQRAHEFEKAIAYLSIERPDVQEALHRKARLELPMASHQICDIQYDVPEEVFVAALPGTQFTGFMDFDEYIAGVVAAEMGDSFPFEALKTQAVTSRTYALERYERTGTANGGQAYTAFFSASGQSHVAARNTHGAVILYDHELPVAFFSARCNGDFTLASEDGLSCIPAGCSNPCTVGGLIPSSPPLAYARSRTCSGHDSCALTSEPCCEVFADGRTQFLYGHGVGMCQRGAQQLACRDGHEAKDILARYYTDVILTNPPVMAQGARVATTTGLNARTGPCEADRVVVPADTAGTVIAGPLPSACASLGSCDGRSGTWWTWWQVDFDNGITGRWVVEDFVEQVVPAPPQVPCANPVSGAEQPTAADCLFILNVAVELETCVPECVCKPTGNLTVSTRDALVCLQSTVALPVELDCPCPCTGPVW